LEDFGFKVGHLKSFAKMPENVDDNEDLDAYFFHEGELKLDIQDDKIELFLKREFKISAKSMLNDHQECRRSIIGGKFYFTASFEGDLEDNEYSLEFH
jgi:hypothetical protein